MQQLSTVEDVQAVLRERGLRWTPIKAAVVGVLLGQDAHRSAAEVHRSVRSRFPAAQLSTVHRILHVLAEHGVVHVVDRSGGARYGVAGVRHHHVVCDTCGATTDIPIQVSGTAVGNVGASTGFALDPASLTMHGRCPACAGATRS